MSIYKGTTLISGNPQQTTIPIIGEIKALLCTADYIPNGCLPCDGQEYSAEQFGALWDNYLTGETPKLLTCSYADYATSISTYGQCVKFGIDLTSSRFKVPTIKDGAFLQQALSDSELGKAYNAGLPNITGSFGILGQYYGYETIHSATGSFKQEKAGSRTRLDTNNTGSSETITFDASSSNPIFGSSTTVQPNAITVRYFVVVADGEKNQSVIDWATWINTFEEKADKDLINTHRITNCITELPQDIKLELNNGAVILKAGSKVYVPNGFETDGTTPKFDAIITSSDLTRTTTGEYNDLLYVIDGTALDSRRKSSMFFSGTTAPTGFGQYATWYDTASNIIKRTDDSGSTWKLGNSFPIAEITSVTSSGWIKINQVFNGFGYIGSSLFVLPGVKGLIPNGRNADGSLKSIVINSSQVWTRSWSSNPNYKDLSLATNGIGINTHSYNESENYVYNAGGNRVLDRVVFGRMEYDTSSPYRVTSLTVKSIFHAVDWSTNSTVIETYRNGASWYRIWSDGWVEQGGTFYQNATATTSVNLVITMLDNYYSIILQRMNNSNSYELAVTSTTTTSFSTGTTAAGGDYKWKVEGMSAQS